MVTCTSPELPVTDAFYDNPLPPIMEEANVREIQAMPADRLPQDVIQSDGCSVSHGAPKSALLVLLGLAALRLRRKRF